MKIKQTPWNYPEESIQQSEHSESLKSRILLSCREKRNYIYYKFVLWPSLFHESPTKSGEIILHPIVSPKIGLVNYLISLISFQNVKITNVQLQIATAHFKKCVISTVSVLMQGQSNINAEANEDGENNLKVRVWCMWGRWANVPSLKLHIHSALWRN